MSGINRPSRPGPGPPWSRFLLFLMIFYFLLCSDYLKIVLGFPWVNFNCFLLVFPIVFPTIA